MPFAAQLIDLGTLGYAESIELQRKILDEVLSGARPNSLLFVEHPPVLTLGANFHSENLLLPREEYARHGIEIYETDRGGDITFHGPKQLVIYPIFKLEDFGKDLHRWLRSLEEAVIQMLAVYHLEGYRFPPHTGVWVREKKIAAIGIKVRRWVSMHGIAINCDNDLSPFDLITPCGIQGYGVTSLTQETGRVVTTQELKPIAADIFSKLFLLDLITISTNN